MKKTFLFYSLTFVMPVMLFAQTQMNYWVLPPNRVDFTGATPSSTSLPGSPSASAYSVSNGAYDASGNLLFYVKDNAILNSTGGSVGTLANYTETSGDHATFTDIGNEIAIVPVPSTCRDFYVVYTKYGLGEDYEDTGLLYTKLSISNAGVVTIVSNGNFIDAFGSAFLSIAVSTDGKLYAAGGGTNGVKKYTISSSGISTGTSVYFNIGVNFYSNELELSPDGSKLAWLDIYGGVVNVLDLTVTPASRTGVTYSIGSANGYYGIEFSDNNTVYISISSGVSANSGIYKLIVGSGGGTVGTKTQITSGHYGNTQLEKARDGYIYAVDGNSTPTAGILGKLNVTTATMLSSGLSNVVYSTAQSGNNPSYGFYRLPDQIDGANYNYFFGIGQLTNTYTINGSAVSPTVPINTYTCSTITLTPATTNATSYQVTVNATDPSGNILTGTGNYTYATAIISTAPPATIDLKALDGNHLATYTGYFKITLYVANTCNSINYVGLIQNSTISPASSNFQLLDGNGNSFTPNNTLPGTTVSAYGVGINGAFSTGYIATYQIKVDQVDCSNGTVLTANIVNTAATAVTGGNPTNITGVSLNTKSSPRGYFGDNAGCFKVTYTVANACGPSSQTGYFNEDPINGRLGATNVSNADGSVYPNPTNGLTTLNFTSSETKLVNLTLNNLQGGASHNVITNQAAAQGSNQFTFDTSAIPAGIYFYQVKDDANILQSGKIVITK